MFKKLLEKLFGNERETMKKKLLIGQLKQVELEGMKFYIKRLSASFIFDLQEKQKEKKLAMEETLYILVSESVCDRDGKPLFSEEEARALNVFMLNSLITEAMDFNGLNPDAVDKARAKLKNAQTQGEDSSIIN
jgi:hypothetical protein